MLDSCCTHFSFGMLLQRHQKRLLATSAVVDLRAGSVPACLDSRLLKARLPQLAVQCSSLA